MSWTHWTEGELDLIRDEYPHIPNSILKEKLPNRNPNTIMEKARELGLKKTKKCLKKICSVSSTVPIKTPNLKPNPNLAYMLGCLFSDGSVNISKRKTGRINYSIEMRVRDIDFINEFQNVVSKVLGKPKTKIVHYKDGLLKCQYQDKNMVLFLKKATITQLLPFIIKYPKKFIRGLFDGDGYTVITTNKRYGLFYSLAFLTSNKEISDLTINLLSRLGYSPKLQKIKNYFPSKLKNGHIIRGKIPLFRVCLHRKSDTEKFANEIGFSIDRKQNKLLDAISITKEFGQGKASDIWRNRYVKRGREWIKRRKENGNL